MNRRGRPIVCLLLEWSRETSSLEFSAGLGLRFAIRSKKEFQMTLRCREAGHAVRLHHDLLKGFEADGPVPVDQIVDDGFYVQARPRSTSEMPRISQRCEDVHIA